ncbi:hypothetical protein CDAR_498591 [Caerostris darwini]|uniref:Uncharacterized protein n=1 Tax=Caerostris darwini TaxID=1538125 RepID=A0AAV4SMA2_9ARAC|nr:hypothetical protein CDAR_498591 [Caerostris darwini]
MEKKGMELIKHLRNQKALSLFPSVEKEALLQVECPERIPVLCHGREVPMLTFIRELLLCFSLEEEETQRKASFQSTCFLLSERSSTACLPLSFLE